MALDRRAFLAGAAAFASTPALGYGGGGALTLVDPLLIAATVSSDGSNITAFTDPTGKSKVALPYPGLRNLVLVSAGQSNGANTFPTAYTPINVGKVFNFNIFDGFTYLAADPLLGCTRSGAPYGDGNYLGRLADKLINAGTCDNVILVPLSVDASAVADWNAPSLNSYFATTFARLKMRGLSASAILWGQGETDTVLVTSQGAYAASLSALIASTRAYGFTCPWFVAQQTMDMGGVSAAVQAAQAAAINHPAGIWAGPNADSLAGSTYRELAPAPTLTHFTDLGADVYAGLWQAALHAYGPPF